MFDQLGWGEVSVLMLLALFVFGPERLPSLAADLGRGASQVRRWLSSVTTEIKRDLSPELGDLGADLKQLHPRALATQLLDDGESVPPPR